ncbi:MAG: hypothetical protein PUP91_09690 [Rhizonema sp. PD37]|nr:hypothetical protein [Rhizonema sp. PD37]
MSYNSGCIKVIRSFGVGGSYGQKDYWLGQPDPASPQEPLRYADSEPRVSKTRKDGLTIGSDRRN